MSKREKLGRIEEKNVLNTTQPDTGEDEDDGLSFDDFELFVKDSDTKNVERGELSTSYSSQTKLNFKRLDYMYRRACVRNGIAIPARDITPADREERLRQSLIRIFEIQRDLELKEQSIKEKSIKKNGLRTKKHSNIFKEAFSEEVTSPLESESEQSNKSESNKKQHRLPLLASLKSIFKMA